MADSYEIKFQGDTLFSASEGEFRFKRGLKRRRIVVDDVVGGVVIKDGCDGAAEHTLTLEFATTSTNAAIIEAVIYDRLQDFWNGMPGTLEVPEFIPLPNCVIMDVDLSEQTRTSTVPGIPASQTIVDGVTVVATIQFVQT